MIASLDTRTAPFERLGNEYVRFLQALKTRGFEGEIAPDYANRTVLATDNSIYQRLPQAAVYPKHAEDLERLTRLAAQTTHRSIVLTPRGGGTGTNGQSLTDGIVVDVSRHMNRILEIDVENRRVRVQAGVIKDQLNAALKPHGLFFAPELSTSNRATIGGMISTDASGQGSCEYGKTRDHVLELDTVLIGGQHLHSRALTPDEEQAERQQEGILGRVHTIAAEIIDQQRELIETKFPPLNRCLTGYDLAHLRDDEGQLNLNSLLCGSEGSLGFLNEAVLNVLPIPKHSTLVNVRYTSFMDALRDAKTLKAASARPTSIETVDDTVLQLAMEDFVWDSVAEFFPATGTAPIRGINLIEFNDDDESALAARVEAFTGHLSQDTTVDAWAIPWQRDAGRFRKSTLCANARWGCSAMCKGKSARFHLWKIPLCHRNIWRTLLPSSAPRWMPRALLWDVWSCGCGGTPRTPRHRYEGSRAGKTDSSGLR